MFSLVYCLLNAGSPRYEMAAVDYRSTLMSHLGLDGLPEEKETRDEEDPSLSPHGSPKNCTDDSVQKKLLATKQSDSDLAVAGFMATEVSE